MRRHEGWFGPVDIAVLGGIVATIVVAMWALHGGVTGVLAGGSMAWSSLGQITGLVASLFVLGGLTLAGRPDFLERSVGLDRLLVWHRNLGGASAIALCSHIVFETIARSEPSGVMNAIRAYTGGEPYMALATVGALGIFVVTLSSVRSIRRRMTYETWYAIHLLAYLSLAAAFAHQIVIGTDFVSDGVAWLFWVVLNAAAFATLVGSRWGELIAAVLRPLRVVNNVQVAPGVHEITLTGARLQSLLADSGQFAFLRVLDRDLWWQSHPFSLSSTPKEHEYRFTIKELGDSTRLVTRLRPGARVALEGPYGNITPERIGDRRALLIAGGVGISPIKAILEQLGPQHRPVVVYRARSERDFAHLDSLRALVAARSGELHVISGRRDEFREDPFAASSLLRVAPDLAQRHVVVCGPESLIRSVVRGAKAAGVPKSRVDHERSWW